MALVSPDTSRSIFVTEQGEVTDFAWSPDGRWLAFITNLGGSAGGQLALVSLESSRLIPVTRPGTVDPGLTWSQDSRSLALLYRMNPEKDRSPLALRLFDISTQQVVTVTTYSNQLLPDPEIPSLCPQAFPYPLLPVCMGPGSWFLDIWDVQTGQKVAALGSISYLGYACGHVWLPKGEGLFIPRVEGGEEGIKQEGVEEEIIHPISLALWRRGDEAPTVILQGTKRQSYRPVRWLSDGRLVFCAMEWEKEEYEGPAQPERMEYRFLSVDESGEVQEVEGDLPWWAADGFPERLAATGLPRGEVIDWEVGPDEVTVIFTWRWAEGGEFKSAIYLWQGWDKEPVYLAAGWYPRWQFPYTVDESQPPPSNPRIPVEKIIYGPVVEVGEGYITVNDSTRGLVTLHILPETRIWKGKWNSDLPIEVGDALIGHGEPNEDGTVYEMEQMEINVTSLRGVVLDVKKTSEG